MCLAEKRQLHLLTEHEAEKNFVDFVRSIKTPDRFH